MRRLPLLLAGALLARASVLQAQTPSATAIAEARLRFQRGVELTDEGNFTAAMTEFARAWQLTRNPAVLFNISATHEASGHYVEALDAMLEYERLAPPEALQARRSEVDGALTRLRQRIGTITVRTQAQGLEVRIDGLPRPLPEVRGGARVSAGRHRVVLIAPNFRADEHELDIAGGTDQVIDTPLVSTQSSIGVEVNITDAEILIDGRVMARSPAESPFGVAEGPHHVVVRRAGYSTYETDVNSIGSGARVQARLAWLEPVPPGVASRFRVQASEPNAVATMDGRRIRPEGDMVPPGAHRVRVEREDFLPEDRDVDLMPSRETTLTVHLDPTPAYRERYLSHVRGVRWTGVGVLGAGLALAGTGLALFLVNEPTFATDQGAYNSAHAAFATCQANRMSCTNFSALQNADIAAEDKLAQTNALRLGSLAGLGVGAVTMVVGLVVLLTAPSSSRFDRVALSPTGPVRLRAGLGHLGLELSF
ncbi:MAG: PEGA domain-containing protein [Deltaproteobacteria bacterium]|nr:PEGA domain-containing protein [Deltaproteobacteria bacterium]